MAFNSQGACQKCGGTGIVHTVDMASLVPDDSLTIDDGAVAPWNSLMWSLMTDVCREMGVRTDVPFRDLTEQEKDIVYHGPAVKKHLFYKSKKYGNMQVNWILHILMPFTRWRMLLQKSKMKKA